ncbi:MAG: complexin-2 [Ruminococcus flavefaciens]|nr:complexin-2 [Ruminococcus flavefaciens]
MSKNVQIDRDFFFEIYDYFFGDDSPKDCRADEIRYQLNDKLDKMLAREFFSEYKRSPSGEEREELRRRYLDYCGYSRDFCSDVEIHKDEL